MPVKVIKSTSRQDKRCHHGFTEHHNVPFTSNKNFKVKQAWLNKGSCIQVSEHKKVHNWTKILQLYFKSTMRKGKSKEVTVWVAVG